MNATFQPFSPKLGITMDKFFYQNMQCHSQLSYATHPHYSYKSNYYDPKNYYAN